MAHYVDLQVGKQEEGKEEIESVKSSLKKLRRVVKSLSGEEQGRT